MAVLMRCSAGFRLAGRATATGFMLAASATAWAQEIQYGPLATPVPTLGGAALVMLAGLMLFALWRMKKSGGLGGSRFLALALMTGALASGVSGVKIFADARANGGANNVVMDVPGGGTVELFEGMNCVRNVTTVVQQILAINAPPPDNGGVNDGSCFQAPQGGGLAALCTVGMQLQPELACFIDVGIVIDSNGGQ